MPSNLVWWGALEISKGNEQAILDLVEAKIEAKEKELLEAMNRVYKDIMSRGSEPDLIYCDIGLYGLMRRAMGLSQGGIRSRKARKRRMRNEYLQRRARA